MQGIRVVEVAEYGMVPSAVAVLADWGADVVKIEHATRADPIRGVMAWGVPPNTGGFTYLWEPFNRGKRSVALDLTVPEAYDVLIQLVKEADIFVTNFLPSTRKKLRIDVEDLRSVNPNLIYGRGSAHGPKGEEADRGGFDGLTYWLRSGAGWAAMPANSDQLITLPAPAFGDIQTGMGLAGGLSAALFHRERTGEATVVDISLLSSGVWAMQTSLVGANISNQREMQHTDRTSAWNPLSNQYRTKDGRFIALGMLQPDRFWEKFCRISGRDDLAEDPRYLNINIRAENNKSCIADLDALFATKTLDEWVEILSRQDGPWSVVQVVTDLNNDKQVWENGFLQVVDYGDGRKLTLASPPVQFNETPPDLRPAPEHGAHTEEVLLEMGLGWDDISRLRQRGALG